MRLTNLLLIFFLGQSCTTIGQGWVKVDEGMSADQVSAVMEREPGEKRTYDGAHESWHYRQYCILFKDGKVVSKEKTEGRSKENYIVYTHRKRLLAACDPSGKRPVQETHSAPYFRRDIIHPADKEAK